MWVDAAEPKAERAIARQAIQKISKVIETRPGWISVATTGLNIPRTPPFAAVAHGVTCLFQQIRYPLNASTSWVALLRMMEL